jgi:hypothetical protein
MKLTDSQLIIMTEAAKRDDRMVVLPDKLKGGAATKVVPPLLKGKLLEEITAPSKELTWRRGEVGQAKALRLTRAGLKAIAADEGEGELDSATTADAPAADPSPKRQKAQRAKAPRGAKTVDPQRGPSKQDVVLGLLRSKSGVSLDALIDATGWQAHSVRGFLSGVVKKKLSLDLQSEGSGADRIYRVVENAPETPAGKALGKPDKGKTVGRNNDESKSAAGKVRVGKSAKVASATGS